MDMNPKLLEKQQEFAQIKFEKIQDIDPKNDFHLYNINYYEREL